MREWYPGQMIPQYNTELFIDIFETPEQFVSECKASPLLSYKNGNETKYFLTDENLTKLFWLIFSRHGNDPIANMSIGQFKTKMFAIIFQYGPTWQRRLELQIEARALTTDEASQGTFSVYNHAFNDSTIIQDQANIDGELKFVNDQNVSKYRKGKTDTIVNLWEILKVDVTDSFLNKFDKLFKIVDGPEDLTIYTTVITED